MLKTLVGSVLVKLVLIGLVFLTVPMMLYGRFAAVDEERQQLLLSNLQNQGHLLAQSLELALRAEGPRAPVAAAGWVAKLGTSSLRIKLLLRPAGEQQSFYYVAAFPAIDAAYLDAERQALLNAGLLSKVEESCAGNRSLSQTFTGPTGTIEILTSISPFHTEVGCWAVITAYAESDPAGATLSRPFASAPEVRWAGVFYGVMALLILAVAVSVTLGLRRFARLARLIRRLPGRRQISFAQATPVPELKPVAVEFDSLVTTLETSARSIREAAEENAHALKAPIAAMAQAVEPVRRMAAATGDPQGKRAVETIERALERLEDLVASARRIDEAIAEMIDAPSAPIKLSDMVANTGRAFAEAHGNNVKIVTDIEPGIKVAASEEALETAIENLVDNAVSFAPAGSTVRLELKQGGGRAKLSVIDQGPGVPVDLLPAIFERHVSHRPQGNGAGAAGGPHFGLGLAIVRRNIELMGGRVAARNRPEGGFEVTISLPMGN
ncbi:sensor histidine kinase [Dongia sp.]|uniref:sensor histidine kinase n=1 Tax=Dongia sp. TaxID=1977262 RepID=UPI0035B02714